MSSFTELLTGTEDYLNPNAFRRKAFSLSHAYLRGSTVTNDRRVLEIAKDAPDYVQFLLKNGNTGLHHFEYHAKERLTPVDKTRTVESFSITPDLAEGLATTLHIPLGNTDENAGSLSQTDIEAKISSGKDERLWVLDAYDPYRPLINAGIHSFADFSGHPELLKQYEPDIIRATLSASILDVLEGVLGKEKAAFMYSDRNTNHFSFLIPEHVAKALEIECQKRGLGLTVIQRPLSTIESESTHIDTGAPKGGFFR